MTEPALVAGGWRPSTGHDIFATIDHRPSTIDHRPSTIDPRTGAALATMRSSPTTLSRRLPQIPTEIQDGMICENWKQTFSEWAT